MKKTINRIASAFAVFADLYSGGQHLSKPIETLKIETKKLNIKLVNNQRKEFGMKKKMLLIVFSALLCTVSPSRANTGSGGDKLEKAIGVYTANLAHSNDGIVESVIFNVMRMKKEYPNLDYSNIYSALKALAVDSPSEVIRYKAFIALNYFVNSERFPLIENIEPDQPAEFFRDLSEKLSLHLIGA